MTPPRAKRVVALIGDPVAHSVSPAMHEAAFRHVGLPWRYVTERVTRDDLRRRWPELRRRFGGLNVTIPLKEEILPLLDRVTGEARVARSANTVAVHSDGAAEGFSTDGFGFLAALDRIEPGELRRALVLGTGGAARAVTAALLGRGVQVGIWGRKVSAAKRVAESLAGGVEPVDDRRLQESLVGADLLVNATPVGSVGVPGTPLPPEARLHSGMVVFDLVYRPAYTPLLRAAETAGCATVPGIEMLIEQGARSFEIWTGLPAPRDVMRAAASAAFSAGSPAEAVR